jgi:hypothetical protein
MPMHNWLQIKKRPFSDIDLESDSVNNSSNDEHQLGNHILHLPTRPQLKQVGNPTSTTSQLKTRDSKDSARA